MGKLKANVPTLVEWSSKRCKPCADGASPFSKPRARVFVGKLQGWRLGVKGLAIAKTYVMKDFASAVEFINRIAEAAESEGHHPDLHLTGYRKLTVELSTHSIGGLSENDFILAAKIEALPKNLKMPS